MKRVGFLIEKIADIDNLRLAFWKAGKGKRYSASVVGYSRDLDKNLLAFSRFRPLHQRRFSSSSLCSLYGRHGYLAQ